MHGPHPRSRRLRQCSQTSAAFACALARLPSTLGAVSNPSGSEVSAPARRSLRFRLLLMAHFVVLRPRAEPFGVGVWCADAERG